MIITIPISLANEANGHRVIKKGYEFAKVKKYRAEHPAETRKRHRLQKMVVKSFLESASDSFPLPCLVTFTRHSPREFDDDNLPLAFKWIRDCVSEHILGIADNKAYKAGRADRDPRIKWAYAQAKTKEQENYITISIETSFHQ